MESIGGAATKTSSLVANDVLVVLAFIAAVVGVLIVGILMGVRIRNNRRRRRERQAKGERPSSRSSVSQSRGGEEDEEAGQTVQSESGRRRVRRRRRDHRPRNPSLAESGGLPPARPDDPSPQGFSGPS